LKKRDEMAVQELALPNARSTTEHRLGGPDLISRTWPFFVVAIVVEASLALPPGPVSMSAAVLSVILLGLTAASIFLPWKVLPTWANIVIPLLYTGSALALILAAGGTTSGVGLVVLLPVMWTALNLEPWKSATVLCAVVALEFVASIVPVEVPDSVRLRRVAIYFVLGCLIAYSIHELRNRIARISSQRESINAEMVLTIGELRERNRAATVLGNLVDMLSTCVTREEAYEVIEHSAQEMFGTDGSLSILNPSKDQLEAKCSWGGYAKNEQPFSPDDCWALRRGHEYESRIGDIPCKHLVKSGGVHTLCRPLLAQGEILGVLTVCVRESTEEAVLATEATDLFRQYALLVGEQISIWMANFNLRETLKNLSIRDPLTNLFNRRFMEETLNREMSSAARNHDEVSIMQMDVDHFKEFNDTYGHAVGDVVLRAVAGVILDLFRGSDVPCRYGGEEFTVVLPRCSWDAANARAKELQARIAELEIPIAPDEVLPKPPTLSIGIATSPEHGLSSDVLLRASDMALYAAKTAGRDRIEQAWNAEQIMAADHLVTRDGAEFGSGPPAVAQP
jgi:diguanylate cyclase (GGDEF)-like protein